VRCESAADLCPGSSLDGSDIELRHAPIHFNRPSGLGFLVNVVVEAVEQGCGERGALFAGQRERIP
jgi:hypothetical protein